MPGDNFQVRVCSEGREHFAAAVKLAWANAPGGKATHYVCQLQESVCRECVGAGKKTVWKNQKPAFEYPCPECQSSGKCKPESAMVFLWHEAQVRGVKASPLPYPLTAEAAIDFLWAWLQTAEYGQEPDHDGSNGQGFLVTTGDFWGRVEGCDYAFVGVYPRWQMYGK